MFRNKQELEVTHTNEHQRSDHQKMSSICSPIDECEHLPTKYSRFYSRGRAVIRKDFIDKEDHDERVREETQDMREGNEEEDDGQLTSLCAKSDRSFK